MWSEICDLIPLTTGLDACIEHDIEQLESCIEHNKNKGNIDFAIMLEKDLNKLKTHKELLDNMNPIRRWIHCELQFRKEQAKLQKVIRENKRRLGIWT